MGVCGDGEGTGDTHAGGSNAGGAIGTALAAVAAHLAAEGIDVIAADPEVTATDAAYAAALAGAGFHAIPEIQPSRHRMALALPPDGDGAAVMDGIAKATRQRIRRAERDGVCVLRWDTAEGDLPDTVRPAEPVDAALDRFYGLLRETGDRRGFTFGGPSEFTAWWRRAHAAGHLVYLEARESDPTGDLLGGLVLYRHGRRLSTQHSGDRAERRHDHPGAMHLLRWRAIELALSERRTEMDLGGVDVAGARRPPEPGEPTHGLYEHKRSFGAEWVAPRRGPGARRPAVALQGGTGDVGRWRGGSAREEAGDRRARRGRAARRCRHARGAAAARRAARAAGRGRLDPRRPGRRPTGGDGRPRGASTSAA